MTLLNSTKINEFGMQQLMTYLYTNKLKTHLKNSNPMSKKDQVKQFLANNKPFANHKDAFAIFEKSVKDVTLSRFYMIWNELKKDGGGVIDIKPNDIPKPRVREKVTTSTVSDLKYDDKLFIPIKTHTPMDRIISTDGGVMPATITIMPGESGLGKSTVALEMLGKCKKHHPKMPLLFISSEMNGIHMFKYSKRVKVPGVEILYLGEYEYAHEALEDIFDQGWALVVIDSFQDVIDKIKGSSKMSTGEAETWLISKMDHCRKGNNAKKLYTAFIATQHMTKGAVYTGSTKVKHNTDAMVELKKCDMVEGDTYIEYTKNRDGKTHMRMYFKISDAGITFDENRFEKDIICRKEVEHAKGVIGQRGEEFDNLFLVKENVANTAEEVN